jgi:hypothetical protein
MQVYRVLAEGTLVSDVPGVWLLATWPETGIANPATVIIGMTLSMIVVASHQL